MKRKMMALILATAMGTALLTGCGSGDSKSAASDKVVIWTNMESEADTIIEYGKKWSEETGHEIEVVHETPDVQQFVQATNSADGPDAVVGIANDQLADYVNAGLTAEVPADLYLDEDYSKAASQSCYVDGKRYAVPLAVETTALFYNTDKIAEAPETWDDLLTLAADNGGLQFDGTSIYYDLGFVRAFGGYIFRYEDEAYDASDIGLGNEGAVQAYDYLKTLADAGYVSADITNDIAKSNFQNGETAFFIGGPWDVDGFNTAGISFGVTTVPDLNGEKFVTPVGTQVSFVSQKSDNQELAWEFIMYLVDNGAMDLYKVGARIPAKLSEQENEEIQSDPMAAAFVEQINQGEPMPTVSELGQVWTPFANNIKSLYTGELDAQGVADNVGAQIQEGISMMESGK